MISKLWGYFGSSEQHQYSAIAHKETSPAQENDIMESSRDTREQSSTLPSYTSGDTTNSSSSKSAMLDPIPAFIPSFEGMRGIAVLLTEYSHIGRSRVLCNTTGRMGVSIFYVLSGFLITGVLVHLQDAYATHRKAFRGYRHLVRFYNDRSVRLYPALLLMVLVTCLLEYQVNGRFHEMIGTDLKVTLFYMNDLRFLFGFKGGLWTNTWSLGVEEKYYIFWSLILPLIVSFKNRGRKLILAFIFGISFFCYTFAYFRRTTSPQLFLHHYSPASNIWKMVIGSALRLIPVSNFFRTSKSAWLGILLMPLSLWITFIDIHINTVGWYVIKRKEISFSYLVEPFAALSAVMMICGSLGGNWLLEIYPLRFVGKVSYSFYLYQVPLLKISGWPRGYSGAHVTCTAFVLSLISTFFIEEPLRIRYRRWRGA